MRRRIFLVACLCLVGITIASQARKQRQEPAPGGAVRKMANLAPQLQKLDAHPPAPVWSVDVDWGLTLNQTDLALYQQVAATLTGVNAVPNDRTRYYAAIIDPPDSDVHNWNGLVTDVQADGNGGFVVTATVDPLMDLTEYGSSGSMRSDYAERWLIAADGTVAYLGFLDPNGWAGLATAFAFD